MKRFAFLVTLATTPIVLGACSQVRTGSAVVVAGDVKEDLDARYRLDRIVFQSKVGNACVFDALFAVPDEYFDQLSFMARDRNGCTVLERPFVKVTSNDVRTLALVQSLVYGARKGEFVQALKDKSEWGAWDVIQGLEKEALVGTFVTHDDGTLELIVPGDVNTSVRFTSTDPLQFTIGRWQ